MANHSFGSICLANLLPSSYVSSRRIKIGVWHWSPRIRKRNSRKESITKRLPTFRGKLSKQGSSISLKSVRSLRATCLKLISFGHSHKLHLTTLARLRFRYAIKIDILVDTAIEKADFLGAVFASNSIMNNRNGNYVTDHSAVPKLNALVEWERWHLSFSALFMCSGADSGANGFVSAVYSVGVVPNRPYPPQSDKPIAITSLLSKV